MAVFGEDWNDPKTALWLTLASGLLSGRGNLAQNAGQGLLGGMGAYQDARKMQMLGQQQEMQRKLWQSQISENDAQAAARKAALEQAQKDRQATLEYMQYALTPKMPLGATIMSQQGQELMAGAKPPGVDPMEAMSRGVPLPFVKELQALNAPLHVKKDETIVSPRTFKPLYDNSEKFEIDPTVRLPSGQVVQRNVRTNQRSTLGSGPLVNVNMPGGEKKYVEQAQTKLADIDTSMYSEALMAKSAQKSLGRIKKIVADGGVTGGPFAPIEVWGRNFAAEYGLPINKVIDRNNAKLTAEFTSRIANQVLSGGRGISNDDRKALEAAFPSFNTGIPAEQLPAFISQLEQFNQDKINAWQDRYSTLPDEYKKQYPATFGGYRSTSVAVPGQSESPSLPPNMDSSRVVDFSELPPR